MVTVLASVWLIWGLYVLVMGIYRAHLAHKMRIVDYIFAAPWMVFGLIVDVVFNVTVASAVFIDPPREWLLTGRLKRYVATGVGWRYDTAKYVCDSRLDFFDPNGDHC